MGLVTHAHGDHAAYAVNLHARPQAVFQLLAFLLCHRRKLDDHTFYPRQGRGCGAGGFCACC